MIRSSYPVFIFLLSTFIVTINAQRILRNVTLSSFVDFTPYIINGEIVPKGQFTYATYIFGSQYACTSSLISKTHLLTAAHCNYGLSRVTKAFVGNHNIDDTSSGEFIQIKKIHIHPDYNPDTFANDIAVVELAKPVSSIYAKPVLLSKKKSIQDSVSFAIAAGWGLTDPYDKSSASKNLLQARLSPITLRNCAEEFLIKANNLKKSDFTPADWNILIDRIGLSSSIICSLSIKGTGTGSGDSGGPLKVSSDKGDVLIGVTSAGGKDPSQELPYVFSSVSNAYSFINKYSSGHQWFDGEISNNQLKPPTKQAPKSSSSIHLPSVLLIMISIFICSLALYP